MEKDFTETLDECKNIFDETFNILENLAREVKDEKEDEIVADLELHHLLDMTEDVYYSSKIKKAEFNLTKRNSENNF